MTYSHLIMLTSTPQTKMLGIEGLKLCVKRCMEPKCVAHRGAGNKVWPTEGQATKCGSPRDGQQSVAHRGTGNELDADVDSLPLTAADAFEDDHTRGGRESIRGESQLITKSTVEQSSVSEERFRHCSTDERNDLLELSKLSSLRREHICTACSTAVPRVSADPMIEDWTWLSPRSWMTVRTMPCLWTLPLERGRRKAAANSRFSRTCCKRQVQQHQQNYMALLPIPVSRTHQWDQNLTPPS